MLFDCGQAYVKDLKARLIEYNNYIDKQSEILWYRLTETEGKNVFSSACIDIENALS